MPLLAPNNLSYPVLLSMPRKSTGSGFFLNTPDATYLVTAKHVLFKNGLELFDERAVVTCIGNDLTTKFTFNVNCQALLAANHLRKHDRADVAVLKFGATAGDVLTLTDGIARMNEPPPGVAILGCPIRNTRTLDEAGISNDVIVFGYPASLGREAQIDPSRPLLRRGIIAGKTEDRRIVIDCPVYFGNSGALVLELEGGVTYGIGIATEMVPFVEEHWSKQFNMKIAVRYENSGYALVEPIDRIRDLM